MFIYSLLLIPGTNNRLQEKRNFMNAGIIGLGTYAPEKILTNEDLEKE